MRNSAQIAKLATRVTRPKTKAQIEREKETAREERFAKEAQPILEVAYKRMLRLARRRQVYVFTVIAAGRRFFNDPPKFPELTWTPPPRKPSKPLEEKDWKRIFRELKMINNLATRQFLTLLREGGNKPLQISALEDSGGWRPRAKIDKLVNARFRKAGLPYVMTWDQSLGGREWHHDRHYYVTRAPK